MSRHRMPSPILQGQNHNFVLRKIIFWKLYAAVENRNQMLRFELLRLRLRSVTLQAQNIRSLGAQQMIVVAAVWLVTGGAPLFEGGLMQHVLLRLLSLIGMACRDRYRPHWSWEGPAGGWREDCGNRYNRRLLPDAALWPYQFFLPDRCGR